MSDDQNIRLCLPADAGRVRKTQGSRCTFPSQQTAELMRPAGEHVPQERAQLWKNHLLEIPLQQHRHHPLERTAVGLWPPKVYGFYEVSHVTHFFEIPVSKLLPSHSVIVFAISWCSSTAINAWNFAARKQIIMPKKDHVQRYLTLQTLQLHCPHFKRHSDVEISNLNNILVFRVSI